MKRHDRKPINSHKLWLELLNQRSAPSIGSQSKSKSHNGVNNENDTAKSFYKSQEEYYDESIFLKKTVATLRGENEILKSKIRKDEDDLAKKDKQLSEIITCIENQKSTQDSSVNNFIVIKKLRQNIFHLKSEVKSKENEILQLKSDVKYTRIGEIQTQNEVYLQEVKSLQQLISNLYQKEEPIKQTSTPVNLSTKPKSTKTTARGSVVKKNKELLMENKQLKKEIEKNDELKMSLAEEGRNQSGRKEEDHIIEMERIKKVCRDVNQEKTELQSKYEELSSKYKSLKETLEKKEAEITSLKRHKEEKSPVRTESRIKTPERRSENERNQNQELVQSVLRAYLDRERVVEEAVQEAREAEGPSGGDVVRSALLGYAMRHKILKK